MPRNLLMSSLFTSVAESTAAAEADRDGEAEVQVDWRTDIIADGLSNIQTQT